jgi:hypothetical protein
MQVGDYVKTPRFLNVKIGAIFGDARLAAECGFVGTTDYEDGEWDIKGKHSGHNRMIFAAVKKN